ncbi:MAG: histidine phosphatase family protein [Taibaiella sp.]|nr:histidine phosphatase family protein [Taibaiella sp.]
MQRTVVIIRHAKSSWANPLQSDFDRPLNERGEQDAPVIGERLKKQQVPPDLVIASTARRAKQTAKKIAKATGYDEAKIQWEETLYHCIPSVFEELIAGVPDNVGTVYVVAHNPGITAFVNSLAPHKFTIDNMPTCGAVAAKFDGLHWSDFSRTEKQVFLFEYPKKQHDSK